MRRAPVHRRRRDPRRQGRGRDAEALLPLFDQVVFTRSANPRSLPPATLESLAASSSGPPAEMVADPGGRSSAARELAGRDGAVLATGSIYLIADLVAERRGARASTL